MGSPEIHACLTRGDSDALRLFEVICGRACLLLSCASFFWVPTAYAQSEEPSVATAERASPPEDGASPKDASQADVVQAGEPSKLEVVAPQLTHFEPPAYPAGAYMEGRTADVDLIITVGVDGTVSDPEVLEPQGHGFDEAAQAAALELEFSPALEGGVARSVRIRFRYSFTLERTESEAPNQEVPEVGEIGGIVRLSSTESPLAGAKVVLIDTLGNPYETRTDGSGTWRLSGMPPGIYELSISAEGFEPASSKEHVAAGEALDLTFRLLAKPAANEIVIRGTRPPREVTRRTLERREIERIPGTNGDALRSIQSLPGVARPPGLLGLLVVRGSAPQDTGIFVDGAEVPLIYHFGGLTSVIPTELLDQIDFYPGNFSVRYGRYRGGIVDVELRKPNIDCYGDYGAATEREGCFHGMVQADLIDGRVLVQGPLSRNKEWSFAVAGRRSYIDIPLKPILESTGASVTSAPVYWDYQAIVERNLGPDDKLSFRFFGSDDNLEVIIGDPAAQDPGFGGNLLFGTSFMRGQALYQKALTDDTNIDTVLTVGVQRIDFSLGGNLKFELKSIPIDLRSEIGHQIHRTLKWNLGFDFVTGPFDVYVRAPPTGSPGEAAPSPLATQIPVEQRTSGYTIRPAWYSDLEWQPAKRWRLVPGVRLDYAADSGNAAVNPRLSVRYALFLPEDDVWGGRTTTLKGGIGKFSQPPQFQETDEIFGTPGVDFNDSIHFSLGFEQQLTTQINLSMEGYYKDLYNTVSSRPSYGGSFAYENDGSGRVIGMETLLKYKPDSRFFGWIAYTLSQSLARQCDSCPLRNFAFDQTHNLIALGSYRLGGGWEIGARFRLVSGPLVTPIANPNLPSIYFGDSGSYVPLQGAPASERLPLFHQLDVRLDKRWQFRTWRLSYYIDVQNVYNNATAEAYVYNYNYSQKAYQTGLPFIPNMGLRGEF